MKRHAPVETLHKLVQNGAALTEKDTLERTAFYCAVEAQDVPTVSFFIGLHQQGHDIGLNTFCEKEFHKAPVHIAAFHRSEPMLILLQKAGADFTLQTEGMTALHFALYGWEANEPESIANRDIVAALLIEAGVNPNIPLPKSGFYPAHILAERHTFHDGKMPEWLLQTDLSLKDAEGRHARELALLRKKTIFADELQLAHSALLPSLEHYNHSWNTRRLHAIDTHFVDALSRIHHKNTLKMVFQAPERFQTTPLPVLFLSLPNEALATILSYLKPQDFLVLGQTCTTMYSAFKEAKQACEAFEEKYKEERGEIIESFTKKLEQQRQEQQEEAVEVA